MSKIKERKQWHNGFYGAIELEFRKEKSLLQFLREYQLSKKSLSMDMLIVKKNSRDVLSNDIGAIFRQHNIIEYKNPKDTLGIDQFYKGLSYAYLYKSLGKYADERKATELTLTFIRQAFPRKLFYQLRELGCDIKEHYPGIYYVTGNMLMPVQIVVTTQLDHEQHRALKILSDNVDENDARIFVSEASNYVDQGDRENVDALLQISVAANRSVYDRVKEERYMCDALRDLMKDEIEEEKSKAVAEGLAEGLATGRAEGLATGRAEGEAERKKLEAENKSLKEEIARLKMAML